MIITPNWTVIYTQDDSFRSCWKKLDLIYLIHKYGKKMDGQSPTITELNNLRRSQLILIWQKIKPFDFGIDPIKGVAA